VRRTWLPVAWLALIAGCNRTSTATYIEALQEQIQAQRELTDLLATVTDAETMKAVRPELKKRFAHFQQLAERFKALPTPSREMKAKLENDLGDEARRTIAEMIRQSQRIRELPGGKAFIDGLKLQR
jgi:hypothetical protein